MEQYHSLKVTISRINFRLEYCRSNKPPDDYVQISNEHVKFS